MPEPDGQIVHVIDDDEAVRDSLEALLTVAGYVVATYASAEAYLLEADRTRGCLLVDVHMPGMDGLDLLRAVTQCERPMPVLVLTASREPRIRDRALALGAQAFLTKPISEATLLNALHTACGRP